IGAVTFLAPPASVDEMLGRADQLMYEAKRSGKDAARFQVIGTQLSLHLDREASERPTPSSAVDESSSAA
ncbi:MAG TPA: hypothetical protein VF400_12620, partial [Anaeromyxobacteraceae bacterium]